MKRKRAITSAAGTQSSSAAQTIRQWKADKVEEVQQLTQQLIRLQEQQLQIQETPADLIKSQQNREEATIPTTLSKETEKEHHINFERFPKFPPKASSKNKLIAQVVLWVRMVHCKMNQNYGHMNDSTKNATFVTLLPDFIKLEYKMMNEERVNCSFDELCQRFVEAYTNDEDILMALIMLEKKWLNIVWSKLSPGTWEESLCVGVSLLQAIMSLYPRQLRLLVGNDDSTSCQLGVELQWIHNQTLFYRMLPPEFQKVLPQNSKKYIQAHNEQDFNRYVQTLREIQPTTIYLADDQVLARQMASERKKIMSMYESLEEKNRRFYSPSLL